MPDATASAQSSSRAAERSALVADVLRSHRSNGDNLSSRLRLRVHGESMLPVLWPGNVVEIASCSLEDAQIGEIVLALDNGRLFLHRLVASGPNGFTLRGDSMPGPDPQFAREALLGRLVSNVSDDGSARAGQGQRRRFAANLWPRAVGLFLCYCDPARRLALTIYSRRKAATREFQSVESL